MQGGLRTQVTFATRITDVRLDETRADRERKRTEARNREVLIEHLSQIYSSRKAVREGAETLAELTGVPESKLDEEYREYMQNLGVPKPLAPARE